MKLFATSTLTLALLGLLTVTSALDGEACNEGEEQCSLNGQMIDQCIDGKWTIVKACKPGNICMENPTPLCVLGPVHNGTTKAERDVSATADPGNDAPKSSANEDCRDGDAQCEVLSLILLGRHAIKRCNDDHKWFTDEICNSDAVCSAEPYPRCASIQAVETREADSGEDSMNAKQVNNAELPCSKCKRFRDQCTAVRSPHCRTQTHCRKECINKMKKYLVEDGNHGRYRGTCEYYCPQLCQ